MNKLDYPSISAIFFTEEVGTRKRAECYKCGNKPVEMRMVFDDKVAANSRFPKKYVFCKQHGLEFIKEKIQEFLQCEKKLLGQEEQERIQK